MRKLILGIPILCQGKNSCIQCAINLSKQAYQNSQLDHCQKRCRPTNNGHFKQTLKKHECCMQYAVVFIIPETDWKSNEAQKQNGIKTRGN